MYCLSINYKSAGLQIRQRLNFDEKDCGKIGCELIKKGCISECAVLCTCNRTEVYFCGEKGTENQVIAKLSEKSGIAGYLLSKYVMFFYEDIAVQHLFKVCCGIDSMVIGEDEILGQAKNAYYNAKENNTVGYELNMIFQAAFACAKKVKTHTAISKTSVSVATLAANEAAKFKEKVNVLVIGASGKTGMTVLKNLVSHKNVSVKAVFRKHQHQLKTVGDMGIDVADYSDRYRYISTSDCIISATSSPHYTITMYDLREYISDGKKRLFIDLAVPPDIDGRITELDGAELINIDYFEKLAQENNVLKLSSIETANDMIESDIDTLKKDMIFHRFLPDFDRIRGKISDKPFEELVYRMKAETNSNVFSEFIRVLESFGD